MYREGGSTGQLARSGVSFQARDGERNRKVMGCGLGAWQQSDGWQPACARLYRPSATAASREANLTQGKSRFGIGDRGMITHTCSRRMSDLPYHIILIIVTLT